MDFTFKTYEKLLNSLLARGFSFITFAQYIQAKSSNNQTITLSEVEVPNLKRPTFTLSMDPVRLGLSGAEASRSAKRKPPKQLNPSTNFSMRCTEPAEGSGAEWQQTNKPTSLPLPKSSHAQLPSTTLERQPPALAQRTNLAECKESGKTCFAKVKEWRLIQQPL